MARLRICSSTAAICVVLAGVWTLGCRERDRSSASTPEQPVHLVLITLDTLRADRLGIYGYEQQTSPVLDALASDSVLFDNAIAQSAVTPVSHASILTGLNPFNHGLRSLHGGEGYALPEDELTLAEVMRANGRKTAAFVSAFSAGRHFGLHRGFDNWDEEFPELRGKVVTERGLIRTGSAQRRGDETTDRALAWLESRGEEPFFLWVHYFDVHDPVVLPPSNYLSKFPPRSSSQSDRRLATYDAEVAFMDDQVGRLLRALEDEGLERETVVVVIGDHGEGLGDHGWWGHSILYQEQTRVPFLLAVPGSGWSGRRVDALVRTIDLVPTLVDVMDLECPSGPCTFDGESLRPVIEGESSEPRLAYSESINDLAAYYQSPLSDDSLYAIQDGRFKLIARYEGSEKKPSLLFDLVADPSESRNLIDERPDVEKRLRDHLESLDAVVGRRITPQLDDETRERLRSLGYVK